MLCLLTVGCVSLGIHGPNDWFRPRSAPWNRCPVTEPKACVKACGRCYHRSKALAESFRYWVRVRELNSRGRSWRRAQSEEVWKNVVHSWNVESSSACFLEHRERGWDAAGESLSGESQLVTPVNLYHVNPEWFWSLILCLFFIANLKSALFNHSY